ncbi:T9SS type B sorting domain-containing protein [Runella salmonicolor]|uniref:Gliding motility-associated C-terminal domain-containing protein n=1 Tax=Runella salmonicolor TaxID=2950278 RepID=A0ABT1FL53_9BACT|nr:gliding motility-associated C-terminal domain-containing protein [Runella salmonicolor]MCP1382486.1 gliding motility-associated C-terminal domain-containing protein [Runella salmonicolor]
MLKGIFFIPYFFLLNTSFLIAQPKKWAANWYFGYNAGISFIDGTPKPLSGGVISTWEGCASISDNNGNLLFYTDGSTIRNKKHLVMPGAVDLGGHSSTTQSATIVPLPEEDNIYYVFSIDFSGGEKVLQYSIVDMRLNEGLGGLVSKNNVLLTNSSESLTVIKHCNSIDYWILANELGTNSFKAFKLTNEGLNRKFVESKIGARKGPAGHLKASPNGQKIAVALFSDSFELFDFNPNTGVLSNPMLIRHPEFHPTYGLEFSADNRYLYLAGTLLDGKQIYQFDLTAGSASAVLQSKTLIGKITESYFGALQLGPDNKIYVAINGHNHLAVINNPTLKGTECGFVRDGVSLGGKKSGIGLPNFISAPFNVQPRVFISRSVGNTCKDITLKADIAPNVGNWHYQWYLNGKPINKATQTSIAPAQSGSYQVIVNEISGCHNDTINSEEIDVEFLNANPEFTIANCNNVLLKANANAPFQWVGNDIPREQESQDTLTVAGYGVQKYRLKMFYSDNTSCFVQKELSVVFPPTQAYKLEKKSLVSCDTVTLNAPLSPNWDTYRWKLLDHSTVSTNKVTVRQSGQYIVFVENKQTKCVAKDTVNVVIHQSPSLKNNESFCLSASTLELHAGANGESLMYDWAPNPSKNASLVVDKAGSYHVRVTTPQGCSSSRAIEVVEMQKVTLGSNITLCEGDPVELSPTITHAPNPVSYRWSSGENARTIKPTKSGTYTLTTRQSVCETVDSIKVIIHPLPKIKANETVCLDKEIEAGGLDKDLTYHWQHSAETTPVITISALGVYNVKITNSLGCTATRTISVNTYCPPHVYAPDAFTPNGDGINDFFTLFVASGQPVCLDIYNRWGQLIKRNENESPGWDGQVDGTLSPEGTYPYVFRYKIRNDNLIHEYRGVVILQR